MLDGAHQPASDVVVPPPRREAADAPQIVLVLGWVEHDLVQRVVLYDAAARKVLLPRLGFAPGGKRLQSAKHDRIAARQLEAFPGILRREREARWLCEPLPLLVDPAPP